MARWTQGFRLASSSTRRVATFREAATPCCPSREVERSCAVHRQRTAGAPISGALGIGHRGDADVRGGKNELRAARGSIRKDGPRFPAALGTRRQNDQERLGVNVLPQQDKCIPPQKQLPLNSRQALWRSTAGRWPCLCGHALRCPRLRPTDSPTAGRFSPVGRSPLVSIQRPHGTPPFDRFGCCSSPVILPPDTSAHSRSC